MLESEKFSQELAALGQRFNDRSNSAYIWSKSVKSTVPADGFAVFAQKIWETILENKDLDLPTQREILATFRCDEIAAEALARFSEAVAPLRKTVGDKKVVSDFGAQCDLIVGATLASYLETATHYLPEIVEKKRDALNSSILKGTLKKRRKKTNSHRVFFFWGVELKDLWNTVLSLMLEQAGREFETSLQHSFRSSSKNQTTDFGLAVKALKKEHLGRFVEAVRATVPKV